MDTDYGGKLEDRYHVKSERQDSQGMTEGSISMALPINSPV
jgi:hypothetical protein